MTERDLSEPPATSPIVSCGAGLVLPEVGDVIAERYRISRLVGAGGMGTVFQAETTSVGRRCAIKFLRVERAVQSRSSLRFEREARLLARLEHDHLTAVLDFGRFKGTPYYVMEYLDGETLRQLQQREGALPLSVALDVMRQTCLGMAYAHERGIVHRDLKPDNLMLVTRSDGQRWVKVLDFGVARWHEAEGTQLTPTGAELGTPHYMSPEQARGMKHVDARSDVFALGAILYEMLSGKRVYSGTSYNEILFKLLTQPYEPLAQVLPECSPPVTAVVERCLQRQPSDRYRDARALLEALSQCPSDASQSGSQTTGAVAYEGQRHEPRAASRRAGWMGFAIGTAFGGFAALLIDQHRGGQQPDIALMASQPSVAAPPRAVADEPSALQSYASATNAPTQTAGPTPDASTSTAPRAAPSPEPPRAPVASAETTVPGHGRSSQSHPRRSAQPAPGDHARSERPARAPALPAEPPLEERAPADGEFPFLTSNPYAEQ